MVLPTNFYLLNLPEIAVAPVARPATPVSSGVTAGRKVETKIYRTDKGMTVESSLTRDELRDVLKGLKDSFAQSLYNDLVKYKTLTPNKLAWAHKLALDAIDREMGDEGQEMAASSGPTYTSEDFGDPAPSEPLALAASYKSVFDNMLAWVAKHNWKDRKAYSGKRPNRLMLSVNTDRSRHPGHLSVTDGAPFSESKYYGRITPAGEFIPGPLCNDVTILHLQMLRQSNQWTLCRNTAN